MNKAMMAITKNMNKSLRCTQLTLQNQMHNFAIETVGIQSIKMWRSNKSKPPITSEKCLGEALLHLVAPSKTGLDKHMFVTDDEDIFAKSDKSFTLQLKTAHNLAKTVERNERAPNRHTKQ